MTYALVFVGLIGLVVIGIGIKQKKQSDIIVGALTIILCVFLFFFETF